MVRGPSVSRLEVGRPILFFRVRVFCPSWFLGDSRRLWLETGSSRLGKAAMNVGGAPNDQAVK